VPLVALHPIETGVILLGVLTLVVVLPRGLDVAWPVGVGAALAILAGPLSLPDLDAILGNTWDAELTLIALIILSEVLDANGFFTWAAPHLARAAVWMTLPTLAAFLVAAGAFAWRFRRDIHKPYDPSAVTDPAGAIRDPLVFRAGWIILALLAAAFVALLATNALFG